MDNAQDILKNIFEESNDSNETLELLKFMKYEGVALTNEQVKAIMILNEYEETKDLIDYVMMFRPMVTPTDNYFKLIDKLTMADRIKGNAKLSHLMKANANPANTALKPEDVQPKGFSRKEIEGR